MTVNLPVEEFHQKLRSLCDQKNDGYNLGYDVQVFNTFDRKFFYGKVTDHQFFLKRNSSFSRNSYRIDGRYSANDDGTTKVEYELNYDKGHYWGIRLSPLFAWLLIDPFLYFKGDIPLEGLLYINLFFALSWIWVPVDIYRGKKMLKDFKEEFNII